MRKSKLPRPQEFAAEFAAGLSIDGFCEKYKINRPESVIRYMRMHDIEGAPPIAVRTPQPKPQIIDGPRSDDRRVVIEIADTSYFSKADPQLVRISIPRVTFIHGEYRP